MDKKEKENLKKIILQTKDEILHEFVLTKIDKEDYGLCSICEEEIPYGKLCIVPETTICINCANSN